MLVSVNELGGATDRIAALVKQAQAGDGVIFTLHGQKIARLVPVAATPHASNRRSVLERFQRAASGKITPGPIAERSQDFLYDEGGLPA